MKKIILTGDRPTGRLHIGHYIGSLKNRVDMQNSGIYDEIYIMIADAQALTDNYDNPKKVLDNTIEVAIDYLSAGIDPNKSNIFIQSEIPELTELTFYYSNLVTLSRLTRNPTIKEELKMREFEQNIPVGFLTYPISQSADITAFDATIVPVGDDQLPMIEQARDIVRSFNHIYGDTLVEPEAALTTDKTSRRLVGIDGKSKMSKSLGNAIYMSDDDDTISKRVMQMYTDPEHIQVSMPGRIEGNVVFTYLDIFATDDMIYRHSGEYHTLDEMKSHYMRGGLGDVRIKKVLSAILIEIFTPIRQRREYYTNNIHEVYEILHNGNIKAGAKAAETLKRVKKSIGLQFEVNYAKMKKDM